MKSSASSTVGPRRRSDLTKNTSQQPSSPSKNGNNLVLSRSGVANVNNASNNNNGGGGNAPPASPSSKSANNNGNTNNAPGNSGGGSSTVGGFVSAYPAFLASSSKYSKLVLRRGSVPDGEGGGGAPQSPHDDNPYVSNPDAAPSSIVEMNDRCDNEGILLPLLRNYNTTTNAPSLSPSTTIIGDNHQLVPLGRSASSSATFLTSTSQSSPTTRGGKPNPINGLIKQRRGTAISSAAGLKTSSTPTGTRSFQSRINSRQHPPTLDPLVSSSPTRRRAGGATTPQNISNAVICASVGERNAEDSAILDKVLGSNSASDQLAESMLKHAMQGGSANNKSASSNKQTIATNSNTKRNQQSTTSRGRGVTFIGDSAAAGSPFQSTLSDAEDGDDLNSFLDKLGKEVARFEATSLERRIKLSGGIDHPSKAEIEEEEDLETDADAPKSLNSLFHRSKGRRTSAASSLFGRSGVVSFVSNDDVAKQLEAVLAEEGLELDTRDTFDDELIGWSEESLRNPPPNASPRGGHQSSYQSGGGDESRLVTAAQALDLLSLRAVQATTLHVAPSDRVAAAQKLKAKISKVQRRISVQENKPTPYASLFDGTLGSNGLNGGASAGGNKYLLLNKATRNEFGERDSGEAGGGSGGGRKGPTLMERTMMASASAQRVKLLEAVNKSGLANNNNHNTDGGGDPSETVNKGRLFYHNAHVSHDGITERSLLLKKIEILRQHRPLRLQFLKHISQVKDAKKRMGSVGMNLSAIHAVGDGSFGGGIDSSIQLRNISTINKHRPDEAEESRSAFFKKRWDMICEARERRNDIADKKKKRYIELVERARATGTNYDTGIEVPDDLKYAHGSLVNDQAATWFLFICLSASQRFFGSNARKISIERREREILDHWKARVESKARKLQGWWRRVYLKYKRQMNHDSSTVICSYFRCLPKIQVRFRLAIKNLIFRVIKLQTHFRSMFEYRRRRRQRNDMRIDAVITSECDRLQLQIQSMIKERKKPEGQLASAPKARKPIFHNQIKLANQAIGEVRRHIEFLLALSPASRATMIGSIMKPKERMYTQATKEYGARLHEKYLASRDPHALVEFKTGQRTMGGLLTTSEQRLVERVLNSRAVRPCLSLVVTDDELLGQLEEHGIRMGEVDFLEAALATSTATSASPNRRASVMLESSVLSIASSSAA